jgi:hypothetical protein
MGPAVFGPAYSAMYAGDVHAPGSVDRVIWERMLLLCDQTMAKLYEPPPVAGYRVGTRPVLEAQVALLPSFSCV